MTLFLAGIYILGAITAFRIVFRFLDPDDDVADIGFALCAAFLGALAWPVALPFAPFFGAAWIIQRRRKGEKIWPSSWWPSRR